MENLKELSNEQMKTLNGGRLVIKIDRDGDGRWDEKHVWKNNGTYVARYR